MLNNYTENDDDNCRKRLPSQIIEIALPQIVNDDYLSYEYMKRTLEEPSNGQPGQTNKRVVMNSSVACTDPWSSSTVIFTIAQYLPVQDCLSSSLVSHSFNDVLNSDAVWKVIFEKGYSDRLINEKDPIVGGSILEQVKSKFSSNFKAHYAIKKSFGKLTILSHENVYNRYKKLFAGDADECHFKEGDENFEPTLEMKQLASSWFYGGSDSSNDCENKYAYFFKEDCADYGELLLSRLRNELTGQVIKLVEVPCSNSYGSAHLENDEKAFANSSEGGFYVSKSELNNDSIYADLDLMVWIQRISNSLYGYPEHGLSYLRKFIKVEKYLGERDEKNLLSDKYPIQKEEAEEEEEED